MSSSTKLCAIRATTAPKPKSCPILHVAPASHKSNPSSVPQGYVELYSVLPWATWEVVTGEEEYPDDKRWLTGLWSTQAKVEGVVLKAAWHWGRDCSVVNNALGGPVRTPFCVGLPSAWGSVDGDRMFSPIFVGGFHNWGL